MSRTGWVGMRVGLLTSCAGTLGWPTGLSLAAAVEAVCQSQDDCNLYPTCRSVQSVLDEMAGVLADSGRSMREMATDTKEQQREWWRARWACKSGTL